MMLQEVNTPAILLWKIMALLLWAETHFNHSTGFHIDMCLVCARDVNAVGVH